jgi:tetraacyldisaccharide 4'-kinase
MNRIFLSPFNLLYRAVVRGRATLYETGVFKSHTLGALTVSIGNITVGGTGKTPLVARVARILAENGERVCILTRGYKRENPRRRILVSDGEKILAEVEQAGDEPFELARKLLGISAVVADRHRVEAGNWARANLGITAFVLDDAFQHRRVRRDLDIVCVDATNPFGNGETLPRGILREPLRNLKRADAIVITRANLVEEKQIANLKFQISEINPDCRVFVSENKISNLRQLEEFNAKTQRGKGAKSEPLAVAGGLTLEENSLQINTDSHRFETEDQSLKTENDFLTNKYSAFCALGNPENFFAQLRREKFDLVFTKAFRDHHHYTRKDVAELEKKAEAAGAEGFLTTAKDAVKLEDLQFNLPCFAAEIEMVFDDEDGFRQLLADAAKGKLATKEHEKGTK